MKANDARADWREELGDSGLLLAVARSAVGEEDSWRRVCVVLDCYVRRVLPGELSEVAPELAAEFRGRARVGLDGTDEAEQAMERAVGLLGRRAALDLHLAGMLALCVGLREDEDALAVALEAALDLARALVGGLGPSAPTLIRELLFVPFPTN